MTEPFSDAERSAAVAEARKALRCLYIAVDSSVAANVGMHVEMAFRALGVPPSMPEKQTPDDVIGSDK